MNEEKSTLSKDLIYQQLVQSASKTLFCGELTPDEKAKCRRMSLGNDRAHNVYLLGRTLRVQLFLGGHQWVLGKYKFNNYETAYRFADMAIVTFWPWRKRTGAFQLSEPDSSALNLGDMARTRTDLQTEASFVDTLDKFKSLFVDENIIPAVPAIRQLGVPREHRRPRNAELEKKLHAVQCDIESLKKELQRVNDRITVWESKNFITGTSNISAV